MKTPKDATQAILRQVCKRHRIKMAELLGDGRHSSYIAARRDAINVLRLAYPGRPLEYIAKALNRDRTTISHHLGRRPSALRHARAHV